MLYVEVANRSNNSRAWFVPAQSVLIRAAFTFFFSFFLFWDGTFFWPTLLNSLKKKIACFWAYFVNFKNWVCLIGNNTHETKSLNERSLGSEHESSIARPWCRAELGCLTTKSLDLINTLTPLLKQRIINENNSKRTLFKTILCWNIFWHYRYV